MTLPAAAALPARAEDANTAASSRMSYSRFLEYLDMGRVKKVRPLALAALHSVYQLNPAESTLEPTALQPELNGRIHIV